MQPSDVIVGDNDTRRGVRVLRSYLEYASSDASMPQTTARNIGGDVDSEFEEEVRVFLAGAGFQVETQREVKGYFVDLCVREANPPHRIICGVECDGARYHSTRAARDRDILREEILESQGWKIVRVWSTDWFRSPARAKERLLADIERARGVSQ